MATKKTPLRWGVEKRMKFIELCLWWGGGINRSDVVDQFGISPPQASNDLSHYRDVAPDNIIYDLSNKRYHASESFKPLFASLDSDHYLSQLKLIVDKMIAPDESWIPALPSVDAVPVPRRRVKPDTLKALVDAIRNKRSLNIYYQSMGEKHREPLWRWITPHAFANDSARWHVRAFCHAEKKFKDFHLSRIRGVKGDDAPAAAPEDDKSWHMMFDAVLIPNPEISKAQQEAIALEYGMQKGKLVVPVRQALLYYFEKSLRIELARKLNRPYEAPVIIGNKEAFDAAARES